MSGDNKNEGNGSNWSTEYLARVTKLHYVRPKVHPPELVFGRESKWGTVSSPIGREGDLNDVRNESNRTDWMEEYAHLIKAQNIIVPTGKEEH